MSTAQLLELARARGQTIATAESCTGGLLAGAITEVAGSSDVFDRGFVTYSNAAKSDLLGVPAGVIAAHGAVSEAVAARMAEGALVNSDATLAVSITGVAGPGASADKPEGRVCFGIATRGGDTDIAVRTETRNFGAIGRSNVRTASVAHALDLMIAALR